MRTLFFLATVLLTSIPLCAQHKADSLKNIWINTQQPDSVRMKAINKYYRIQTFAVPDSVMPVTDLHFTLALESGDYNEMGKAYNEKSYVYYLKGDYKNSMNALERVVEFYEKINNKKGIAIIYGNMGNIYGEQEKYQEALRYFHNTLAIFKDIGNEIGEARMYSSIGIVHNELDDTERAIQYFDKAISLYSKLNLPIRNGTILSEKGEIYLKKKDYVNAYDYTSQSLELLEQENNKFGISKNYLQLSKIQLALNNREKALEYLNKSIAIDLQFNNNSINIERLTHEANLYLEDDLTLATSKAENVLNLIKPETEHHLKVNLYDLLYRCYKKQNKFDKSLEMHEKFTIYNDSLQFQKNRIGIIHDAIQKEYSDKLREQELLNQKENAQIEKQYSNRYYLILGASAVIILLILTLAIISYLKSKKRKQSLLAEIESLKSVHVKSSIRGTSFKLNRFKIESAIDRTLNDTDWSVLNVLVEDPVISNKELASKVFKSIDGVGSSLRRMYDYFDIKDSKYKKISLLMKAIKISNN